ncbi:hypothetical protein VFPBJ_06348 [Purpureocillium lilacinum]|uniref:Uncharacterized protein n=1 Tax=Purpureocillium lilacinum TaxID=33203 RepID=A0A179GM72_PURLI|nr:hypothetical protein VFPBJ_06348 [Purpureocillium lilacinum]
MNINRDKSAARAGRGEGDGHEGRIDPGARPRISEPVVSRGRWWRPCDRSGGPHASRRRHILRRCGAAVRAPIRLDGMDLPRGWRTAPELRLRNGHLHAGRCRSQTLSRMTNQAASNKQEW